MAIASDLIRGHTETIILGYLMEQDGYGYEINKSILAKTDNQYELKEATLYSAFRRLESAQCIQSYWGDEQVGARRKYYKITALGIALYKQKIQEWHHAKTLIDQLVKVGEYDGE